MPAEALETFGAAERDGKKRPSSRDQKALVKLDANLSTVEEQESELGEDLISNSQGSLKHS